MLKRFISRALILGPAGAVLAIGLAATVHWINGVNVFHPTYESSILISVKPPAMGGTFCTFSSKPETSRPSAQYMISTEFDVFRSRFLAESISENLQLTQRWNTSQEDALERISKSIQVDDISGTDIKRITIRLDDPKDARDIALATATAFKTFRATVEAQDMQRQLEELGKAIRKQEETVEKRRKTLAHIIKNQWKEHFSNAQSLTAREPEIRNKKTELKQIIVNLLTYEGDELYRYASKQETPNNSTQDVYARYIRQKALVEKFGPDGPDMDIELIKLKRLQSELDEGIIDMRSSLLKTLKLHEEGYTGPSPQDEKRPSLNAGYDDALQAFETDLDLLQNLKLKKTAETINSKTPRDSVRILSDPTSAKPTTPTIAMRFTKDGIYGLLIGLLLSYSLAARQHSPRNRN